MPAQKPTCATSSCNTIDTIPAEIEAEIEAEAQAAAAAVRARRRNDVRLAMLSIARARDNTTAETPAEHMTRAQYARRSNVSDATVSRWLAEGMPCLPVGSTVRIDPVAADEWRRARPRRPTTPTDPVSTKPAINIDGVLSKAGLRAVAGGVSR